MPEATVEKDGNFHSRKREVAGRPLHSGDRVVDTIAEPARMQLGSNCTLEGVVLARRALHSTADGFGGLQVYGHLRDKDIHTVMIEVALAIVVQRPQWRSLHNVNS